MALPPVHVCHQLTEDNAKLKKKYRKIKKRNADLELELEKAKKEQHLQRFLAEQSGWKSIAVQTDGVRRTQMRSSLGPPNAKKPAKDTEVEKSNKFMLMHNNLMKRYEKELKSNTAYVERIAELNLEKRDIEQQLQNVKKQIQEMEKEKETLKTQAAATKTKNRITPSRQGLLAESSKLRQERDKLAAENQKLKEELKGIDRGFFEEVEDLKFALQQSARLNSAYEKALRKICSQNNVAFPKVKPRTPSSSKKRRSKENETPRRRPGKLRERNREFR